MSVFGDWIEFRLEPRATNRKTDIWQVVEKTSGSTLGLVKWFGRWRRYAFFPHNNTVYERDCLVRLATFCDTKTREHLEAPARRAM